jgi:hypothetical protein
LLLLRPCLKGALPTSSALLLPGQLMTLQLQLLPHWQLTGRRLAALLAASKLLLLLLLQQLCLERI